MAESTAGIGFGTTVQRGDIATPTNFANIAELQDISGPDIEVGSVEVTHQESPDHHKEYIAGLLDGGEVSFDVQTVEGGATRGNLISDLQARQTRYWRVLFPSGGYWQFKAHVAGMSPSNPKEGVMTDSLKLKVTGKPAWTDPV